MDGIRSGKIEIRVYKPKKFHAKAYITHSKLKVVGSAALVGSSNFTRPGLTQNVELNVKFQGPEVAELQEWYEQHWDEATPVNEELLAVLEHNAREFTPFEVYAKALHALTASVDLSTHKHTHTAGAADQNGTQLSTKDHRNHQHGADSPVLDRPDAIVALFRSRPQAGVQVECVKGIIAALHLEIMR